MRSWMEDGGLAPAARWFALVVGVVLLLAGCAPGQTPGEHVGDRVRVEQGELRGDVTAELRSFRAIPYAAAPVGELRWQPPQPAAAWAGTRDATVAASRCVQPASLPGAPAATAASTTEDCLHLNVTTPAGVADGRRPVLVWVHGGGFRTGAGGDVDPRRLVVGGDVVVVTINYRLGALGFLGYPGLPDSGAFGLLDQQAALRWVQRNIAAFGGDPDNVTLIGESAGADSVCAQLASPAAAGLFHRAVLQSTGCTPVNAVDAILPGIGPPGDTWKPLPVLESIGATAAAQVGCPDPATALDCLRALPVETFTGPDPTYWSPATGTATLPIRPSEALDAGGVPAVPVLIGTTRDEGTFFSAVFFEGAGNPLSAEAFREMLAAVAGPDADRATAAYPLDGRSPGRAWADVITDRASACPNLDTYRALAARGPIYAYEFADPAAPSPFAPLPGDLAGGATHGSDVAYLLDLTPGQPKLTPEQHRLADQMIRYWTRFAATGEPGAAGDQPWPPFAARGEILTLATGDPGTTVGSAASFAATHHCDLWSPG